MAFRINGYFEGDLKMKMSLTALCLFGLFGPAYAADFFDTARVISSAPIYERVNQPHRVCNSDTVQSAPRDRSIGGSILGGVAGAILGNQVGGGSGRTAATAAGAIAGAVVGDRVANPNQSGTQQVERCHDVDSYSDVIKGYTVTYRYNGKDATVTLPYHPGSTVQVGISVIQDQTQPQQNSYPDGQTRPYQQDDRRYRNEYRDYPQGDRD